MARPEGFEPPTLCLEGRRSFQLSYGRDAETDDIVREMRAGWKRGNGLACVIAELRDGGCGA